MIYADFKEKLITVGLTEQDFSNLTNTPIATVKGWSAKRKGRTPIVPKWVHPYLELYEKNRHYKEIIKYLEEKPNGKN